MGDLDFLKVKHLHIDYDKLELDLLNKVLEEEPSFQWCISCGCCTASCSAGNHTTFNVSALAYYLEGRDRKLRKRIRKVYALW